MKKKEELSEKIINLDNKKVGKLIAKEIKSENTQTDEIEIDESLLMNIANDAMADSIEIEEDNGETYTIDFANSKISKEGQIEVEKKEITTPSYFEDALIRSILHKKIRTMNQHLDKIREAEWAFFKDNPYGSDKYEETTSMILNREKRELELYSSSKELLNIDSFKDEKLKRTIMIQLSDAAYNLIELL